MDLLRGVHARVYPVGRLDYASEGLLLLTNDGELAHKLMKGASHVAKVYVVKVAGKPDEAGLQKIRRGLMISTAKRLPGQQGSDAVPKSKFLDSGSSSAIGGQNIARNDRGKKRGSNRVRTGPAKIRLIREGDNPWYEVTLTEGRNRQIRRMFEEIGHHVEKIKRVRYGPLSLDVPPGEFRRLSVGEVEKLKSAARVKQSSQ
jgi:23S rRNA pseudouridine2605 synthase